MNYRKRKQIKINKMLKALKHLQILKRQLKKYSYSKDTESLFKQYIKDKLEIVRLNFTSISSIPVLYATNFQSIVEKIKVLIDIKPVSLSLYEQLSNIMLQEQGYRVRQHQGNKKNFEIFIEFKQRLIEELIEDMSGFINKFR